MPKLKEPEPLPKVSWMEFSQDMTDDDKAVILSALQEPGVDGIARAVYSLLDSRRVGQSAYLKLGPGFTYQGCHLKCGQLVNVGGLASTVCTFQSYTTGP